MSQAPEEDRYAAAGIDYASMDPGKVQAQQAAAATAHWLGAKGLAEVAASRGESAYVVELPDRYLSIVNEALGTKNLVADATRSITGRSHYDHIARDTVATVLNDLSSVGGCPIALTAYWAAGSSTWFEDAERLADLTRGWAGACNEAGCTWGGGETQTLPGLIEPHAVVLGGSAVGNIAPKQHLLLGSRLRAGDVMLAAASSGIHANGLTLARKLAAALPQGYATAVPGDPHTRCLGEVLLDPSPLYGPVVEAVQREGLALHYAAHITGHGWRKIMRAPQPFSYVVDHVPMVPPVLQQLRQLANMDAAEAYATFNMGLGFVLFVAAPDAARAQEIAQQLGRPLEQIGRVEAGPRRVVIAPLDVEFAGESLQIR